MRLLNLLLTLCQCKPISVWQLLDCRDFSLIAWRLCNNLLATNRSLRSYSLIDSQSVLMSYEQNKKNWIKLQSDFLYRFIQIYSVRLWDNTVIELGPIQPDIQENEQWGGHHGPCQCQEIIDASLCENLRNHKTVAKMGLGHISRSPAHCWEVWHIINIRLVEGGRQLLLAVDYYTSLHLHQTKPSFCSRNVF